jgi:hypothetical protein
MCDQGKEEEIALSNHELTRGIKKFSAFISEKFDEL